MSKFEFNQIADRRFDHSKKWCRKFLEERFCSLPDDYISMWIADMDYKIAPVITEKFQELLSRQTYGYLYCYGEFFTAVQQWNEEKFGIRIDEESILLNYGVVSTLYHLVPFFCPDPSDAVIINTPVYGPFFDAVEKNKRRLICNPLQLDEQQRYQIDFDLFEQQLKEYKPKMFIFCSPQNPSGRIWSEKEIVKLAKLCYENRVVMVADEVHSDHIRKAPFFSTLELQKPYRDHLVVLCSANKGFNFAGLKTSYSIIPNLTLCGQIKEMLANHAIEEPNVFGIAALIASYSPEGKEWLQASYRYILENYLCVEKFLQERCPQLRLMDLESSYLPWIDVSHTGMDGNEFVLRLAQDTGVILQEGSTFGEEGRNFVRMNIATSRDYVEEALNRMEQWLLANHETNSQAKIPNKE